MPPSPVTLTAIAPQVGHTGGKTFVEIIGSGFRLPPDPPATGIAPPPPRTARVLFGGVEARDVQVLGPDLLWCRTPIHDPGPVNVVVQNMGETPADLVTPGAGPFAISPGATLVLSVTGEEQGVTFGVGDIATPGAATRAEVAAVLNRLRTARATVRSDGRVRLVSDDRGPSAYLEVVSGSATAALGFPAERASGTPVIIPIEEERDELVEAFNFARPKLDTKAPITLALEQLQVELRRQVLPNVSFATHTDYDEDSGDLLNFAALSQLPAIVLGGLEIMESPDRRILGIREESSPAADRTVLKGPADPMDLMLMVIAVSDNPVEGLNLFSVLRRFFRKNGRLIVPRSETEPIDYADPSTFVEYTMDWRAGLPAGVTLEGENANLMKVSGAAVIRGVPVGDMPLEYSGAQPAGAEASAHFEATTGVTYRNESTDLGVEPK